MNSQPSLPPTMRTLVKLLNEGAALFGADETSSADERADCARRWSEACFIVAPMDGILAPTGVYQEGGETGFFFDPPTPGTANFGKIIRHLQGAHEILESHFLDA